MKFLFIGMAVIVNIIFVNSAEAWGKYGHMTICELAYRQMTEATRTEVNRLLVARNEIVNPSRKTTSFNYACLYADDNDRGQRDHPDEHYANYSRDTTEITSKECPTDTPCIFEGIERDYALFSDINADDESRATAMLLLGHWIGDLHQPLHISFSDDRGGNKVRKFKGNTCRGNNLHAVWDTCIQERGIFREKLAKNYFIFNKDKRYSSKVYDYTTIVMPSFPNSKVAEWVATEPYQWANESYQIALDPDTKYCIKNDESCVYELDRPVFKSLPRTPKPTATQKYEHAKKVLIDNAYIEKHALTVETLMFKASARLAHLMNTALDPAYTAPAE